MVLATHVLSTMYDFVTSAAFSAAVALHGAELVVTLMTDPAGNDMHPTPADVSVSSSHGA